MNGPLDGLRVVDCTRGMAGPRATGMLADYGADVVLVEPPGGDPWRPELSVPYSAYHRGKRSIVLDLESAADREVFFDLLGTADVFVESWRPGVAEGLGIGYEIVHERYPDLVYCSVSGFGPTGPHADLGGYDALVNAVLGTMDDQAGHREGPVFIGLPSASNGAAYLAVIGVLASLYRREKDGWGCKVETSLVDGMLAYVSQAWGYSERNRQRYRVGGTRFLIKTLRCADDEYIGVHTGARGAFERLMALLGLDDRVKPLPEGSEAATPLTDDEEAAIATLPDIFEKEPREVWLDRLLENDICALPVLRPGEVFDQPQTIHNQMVVVVDDPQLGRVEQVAPPMKFSTTPAAVRGCAPRIDEHGQEIRAELQGWQASAPVERREARDQRPLLDGVRVLDLGHWFAGPYASRLLADLGADVVKLEPPQGDPMRGLERPFSTAQAGKRSVAADLHDTVVLSAAQSLIEWADVVHHNLGVGVTDRLGVGYADASAINPAVVYVHASGWGAHGPYAARQSFAPLMGGYVGAHYESCGQFNPPLDSVANEDSGGGMLGAISMLMALLHRERSGVGQFIDSPHFHSALADVAHIVRRASDVTVLGADALDPMQFGTGPLHRLYETADGWVCIVAATDSHIKGLEEALGIDVMGDERLRTAQGRAENPYELEKMLSGAIYGISTEMCLARLGAAGVPSAVPSTDNNLPFMDDPHNLAIGRVGEYVHPRFGLTRESGVLMRYDGACVPDHGRPPELGEHTDEILSFVGFAPQEISDLHRRGVAR